MEIMDSFFYNDSAKNSLLTMAQNGRMPHALLIEGRSGSGKTHFARIAAACAMCGEVKKPCGKCKACVKIMSDTHPDVELYSGSGSARSFHIDSVREIRSGAFVLPTEGEKRIYILKNAHNMTVQAQNALLKLIEEPPAGTMFILTAPSRHSLLPTIASRTAVIALQTPPVQECESALRELRPGRQEKEYSGAAAEAHGSIGEALSYLDNPKQLATRLDAYEAANMLAGANRLGILHIFARHERDRQDMLLLCDSLYSVMSRILVCKGGSQDAQNSIKMLSGRFTALQAAKSADIIEDTVQKINQNGNIGLLGARLCARLMKAAQQ